MPRARGRPNVQRMSPDGRVRQSQVVTTYGPGALVDLINDAVLIGGLDFWRLKDDGELVHEDRLRDQINQLLEPSGRRLDHAQPFRRPPAGDEDTPNEACGVQVQRFPRWFVCQNPACRSLVKVNELTHRGTSYLHECGGADRRTERCLPVRFVVACERGHLDDLNWSGWVHQGPVCAAPRLRFDEGATGDFVEVRVTCTGCNRVRQLLDLTHKEAAFGCSGQRPWLGTEGREECDRKQRLLVRTASNAYFSQVQSAISIPPKDSKRERVKRVWDVFEAIEDKGEVATLRKARKAREELVGVSDEEIWQAIQEIRANVREVRPALRVEEYQQLTSQPLEQPGELPGVNADFWARGIVPERGLPRGVSRLVLVRRLRQVVAQIGFTRFDPIPRDVEGEYEPGLQVRMAPLGTERRDWLPAIELRGEGFFIELDDAALKEWEQRPAVVERAKQLAAGYEQWTRISRSTMQFPGPRFYLLHSLSHLLMNAVSLECGYPASAISERIYCSKPGAAVTMSGLLLSTGTSGCEGTLGGLIEEGKRLREHLDSALAGANLCSNDPVCAHHQPRAGERFLEGAACHGCLFMPECSCERFNQFLDRAMVVPTMGTPDAGYFSTRR